MVRRLWLALALVAGVALGQLQPGGLVKGDGSESGGGGGSGTVTEFTLGTLSFPLSGSVANGTTTPALSLGLTFTALGDLVYGGAAGAGTRLAGNTTTTRKFLRQTGDGAASAAPAWDTLLAADVPTLNQNTTGSAGSVTGLSVTAGKTLSVAKSMTLTAADDTGVYTLPTGTKTLAATDSNISGTAANLSGTPALPNGTTATTQSASDNSTKLATTAYVDRFSAPNSTTLPATCTVGQIYVDTDATSGSRTYLCESTNTWAVIGSGGAPGGSNTQVQFNDSSAFGGDAQLTFNKTSGLTTITGAGHAGAALLKTAPDSGASFIQLNDNGTMTIDSDTGTGTNPLVIKYAGSTIWTIGFGGTVTQGSTTLASNALGFGGGNEFLSHVSNGVFGIGTSSGAFDATLKLASLQVAGTNGSIANSTRTSELLTLSTGATTTATSGNLAPANSEVTAILARVTTTITTSANWSVAVTSGLAGCTTAWVAIGTTTSAQTGLTAGTTVTFVPASGLRCTVGTASTLTVTLNANPGAGVIRLTPIYTQFTPPTS